jgi:hypothetical protein
MDAVDETSGQIFTQASLDVEARHAEVQQSVHGSAEVVVVCLRVRLLSVLVEASRFTSQHVDVDAVACFKGFCPPQYRTVR